MFYYIFFFHQHNRLRYAFLDNPFPLCLSQELFSLEDDLPSLREAGLFIDASVDEISFQLTFPRTRVALELLLVDDTG